jgi:hypothetical protein
MTVQKHTPEKIAQAFARHGTVAKAARALEVNAGTIRNGLRKLGILKEPTDIVCPVCNQVGVKHGRRRACVECVKKQHRQMWRDRKERSVTGAEPVGAAACGGWQASLSDTYLRKPLVVACG